MKRSSKQRAASKAAFALAAKLSLEQRKYRAQRARIQRDAYKEIQKVLPDDFDRAPEAVRTPKSEPQIPSAASAPIIAVGVPQPPFPARRWTWPLPRPPSPRIAAISVAARNFLAP